MIERFESLIFNLVKKNTRIKNALVYVYQRVFCIFGLIKGKLNTTLEVKVINGGYFGFHDRISLNNDGLIIRHKKTSNSNQISFYDSINDTEVFNLEAKCCNFQQGSLATFYTNDVVAFNSFESNGFPSTVLLNVKSQEAIKKLPFHFFSVSVKGTYFSSINFLRFGIGLPGYGYSVDYDESFTQDSLEALPKPGVSDLIIYSKKSDKIIKSFSIEKLVDGAFGLIKDGYHYFSHTGFSKDEKKMFFLLRSSNKNYNSSQLYVYNLEKNKLSSLNTGGMVSHLSWLSDNEIVAYCNVQSGPDGYYVFNVDNNEYKKLNLDGLHMDGHPHYVSDGVFVTDTYPDRTRRQGLYLVDTNKGNVQKLLSIYSPLCFRGNDRVDLHPRLSLCGRFITIDTSHEGSRDQMIIRLEL